MFITNAAAILSCLMISFRATLLRTAFLESCCVRLPYWSVAAALAFYVCVKVRLPTCVFIKLNSASISCMCHIVLTWKSPSFFRIWKSVIIFHEVKSIPRRVAVSHKKASIIFNSWSILDVLHDSQLGVVGSDPVCDLIFSTLFYFPHSSLLSVLVLIFWLRLALQVFLKIRKHTLVCLLVLEIYRWWLLV